MSYCVSENRIHFINQELNVFFSTVFHDDKNSTYITAQKGFSWVQEDGQPLSVVSDYLLSPDFHAETNSHISVNGFCGKAADENSCRQVNAIVIDIDAHKIEDIDELEDEKSVAYQKLWAAVDDGIIPEPSLIVDSGRGYQVYYIYEKSIPYRRIDGSINIRGLYTHKAIYQRLFDAFQQVLSCSAISIDRCVSNVNRLFRLPGTLNTKSGTHAFVKYVENVQWTFGKFKEFFGDLRPVQASPLQDPAPTFIPECNESAVNNIHKRRIYDLEKLISLRRGNNELHREIMCFIFYQSAIQLYSPENAKAALYDFNQHFAPESGIEESELKHIIEYANKKQYKFSWKKIVALLNISPEEETQLFSKRYIRYKSYAPVKAANVAKKAKRNSKILELAAAGLNHASIAEAVDVCLRTVQYVLAEAKATRAYSMQRSYISTEIRSMLKAVISASKRACRYHQVLFQRANVQFFTYSSGESVNIVTTWLIKKVLLR